WSTLMKDSGDLSVKSAALEIEVERLRRQSLVSGDTELLLQFWKKTADYMQTLRNGLTNAVMLKGVFDELTKRRAEFTNQAGPLLERAKVISAEGNHLMSDFKEFGRRLFDAVPENPVAKTQTDADGEFEIAAPAGNGAALYAKVSRESDGQARHDYWFFRLSEADYRGKLLLSNHNMARVNSDIDVFFVSDDLEKRLSEEFVELKEFVRTNIAEALPATNQPTRIGPSTHRRGGTVLGV